MRVVIVLPLLTIKGGPQRFVIELAEALRERGHSVYLYSFLYSQDTFRCDTKYIKTFFKELHFPLKTFTLRLIRKLLRVLQERQGKLDPRIMGIPSSIFVVPMLALLSYMKVKPHVVLINSGHMLIGILKPFLRNTKIICFYHNPPISLSANMRLIRKILYVVDKFTLLKCIPVANSSYTSNEIKRTFGVRPHVLNLGVNISRFSALERKTCNDKVLFYLSSFGPPRRQKFLIELLSKVLKEIKEVKLILAGRFNPGYKGYYLELLRTIKKCKISASVEMYINPSEDKVLELFSRATIYLNPALEHFGINILEAMAAGLPVIVYKEGGQLDFVKHGVNGFIAGDDINEWVRYTLQLLTNNELYEKMVKVAKETAIKFSWDKVAERFERLIQYFVREECNETS